MPETKDLALIKAVVDASLQEADESGTALKGSISRLFALVETGERDFEVLKCAVLNKDAARP